MTGDFAPTWSGGDNDPMGFNPHRQYKAKGLADYAFVAVGTLLAIALVAWAFLG